jgi:predicted transposase YdaD
MIDHDRLFKELLTTFFVEFVELFLPEVSAQLERNSVVFLDKEVFTDVTAGERREADLVVRARLRGEETFFLIHVEHQSSPQAEFGKRMFRYFARLHEKHDVPIYPVVIFSYDTPQRAEPDRFQVRLRDRVVLDFWYHAVQLNRLSWRDCVAQPNPIASALMSKMQIAPEERARVKLECLRMLATLRLDPARTKLVGGFMETYLQLTAVEQEQYQEEFEALPTQEKEEVMQLTTSWEQEGLQQGRREGRQQGRQEEALSFTLRLLRLRIGALPPELEHRLSALSTEQLESLGEALLGFSRVSEVEAWLAQHS